MQYVYVLQSERDNELYIGCTKDIKERIKLHNARKVPFTAGRTPLSLVYYEAFVNNTDALYS